MPRQFRLRKRAGAEACYSFLQATRLPLPGFTCAMAWQAAAQLMHRNRPMMSKTAEIFLLSNIVAQEIVRFPSVWIDLSRRKRSNRAVRTNRTTTLVALAVLLTATATMFAANPLMGTWKLNEAKSKFAPG